MLLLAVAGVPAHAQNQAPSTSQKSSSGSSLGDYARQIRKEPGAKSTPKVFDNDNLPREDKLSIVGQKSAPASDDSKTAKSEEPATDSPGCGRRDNWNPSPNGGRGQCRNRTEGSVERRRQGSGR